MNDDEKDIIDLLTRKIEYLTKFKELSERFILKPSQTVEIDTESYISLLDKRSTYLERCKIVDSKLKKITSYKEFSNSNAKIILLNNNLKNLVKSIIALEDSVNLKRDDVRKKANSEMKIVKSSQKINAMYFQNNSTIGRKFDITK